MGRPIKWRRIEQVPKVLRFAPSDAPPGDLAENILKVEEYEAIRLKDLEGLEQEACADQMQVSRPTFQRVLISARQKVADSLINGKGIRIEGGNFTENICSVSCLDCGQHWVESVESLTRVEQIYQCPTCHSTNLRCASAEMGFGRGAGGGHCRRGCRRQGIASHFDGL